MSTETAAPESFDLLVFWYHNRRKILIYTGVIVAALAAYGILQFLDLRTRNASQEMLAKATTAEQLRAVARAYPGTRVGGNALLLSADKLREEKK